MMLEHVGEQAGKQGVAASVKLGCIIDFLSISDYCDQAVFVSKETWSKRCWSSSSETQHLSLLAYTKATVSEALL